MNGAPPDRGASSFAILYEVVLSAFLMFVIVDPQVVDVAFPGRDGSFGMNLPAGEYILKAFFNGKQVGRAVSVSAKDKGNIDIKEPLNVGEGEGGK